VKELRALRGIGLLLDPSVSRALDPWLDPIAPPASNPYIDVELFDGSPPSSIEVLVREESAWLGRTRESVIVGDYGAGWFSVQGTPPIVCGNLGWRGGVPSIRLFEDALLIALRALGVYGLHAGAVTQDNRALILLGDSGSGKSTTAMALVSAGWSYMGDDHLLVRERNGQIELLGIAPDFRLTDQTRARFENLSTHLSRAPGGKWELDTRAAFPNRHTRNWHGPRYLLFLERVHAEQSRLAPLSLLEATGRLLAQSPALGLDCHPNPKQHVALLALLARSSVTLRLELGGEWLMAPERAAKALQQALAEHGERVEIG